MSFSAADLVATIQLGGVETAGRDLDKLRGKLNDTDTVASKIGKTAAATFHGTATAIGVAGTAAAIYVGKLLSTGVAYNQLQQTSRAALRTLLGGAEQANAQMDKLDAFARNSPFSKSVFISAQQQLIGFGFEAQKVIPILDAVQDAVAAVGGSNQQISEIVSILARIRSSGKLTADDFNMLGQRGLDAATLLGQGFGKSAAEIRESVTKGTLDAGEAIDVLVAQMGAKFEGAASNVKETFAGTRDRIAAASRDIGAALAEPFVSKNGGGMAVVWGNQVADIMRAVESHTSPVVSMLISRAMPAFAGMTKNLEETRVQIRSWDSSRLESGLDAMSGHGPALAALAGAVLGVNSQLLASLPIIGRLVPAFGPLGGALAGAALASPELRRELGALLGELKPLLPVTVNIASTMSGALNAALPVVATGIRAVVAVAGPLVDVLGSIPSPMLATALAGVAVFTAMRSGAPVIQSFVDGLRRIGEQAAVQAALAGMDGNASRLSGTFGLAGKAATGLGNSLKAAFISNPVGLIILGVSTAAAILTAALSAQAQRAQEVREKVAAYKDTLVSATGEITQATRELAEASLENRESWLWMESSSVAETAQKLGLSLETVTDAMLGNADAMATVKAALEDESNQWKISSLEQQNFTNTVEINAEASRRAAEETRKKTEEDRRAAAAMSEAERSNVRLNEALRITSDVGADATSRLQAFKQVLDELRDGTKSQADLTQELNDQVRSLDQAFAVTDENGKRLASTLVLANGEIDTGTDAGSRLRTQVQGLGDDYLNAMRAASDAAQKNGEYSVSLEEGRAIHERYATALANSAREAGLGEEAIAALVAATLEQPGLVSTIFSSNATDETVKTMELALQILATPDGEFTISSESFPGLMDALSALGVKTQELPEGIVRVQKDDGSFAVVRQALDGLPRDIRVNVSAFYGGGVNMNPDLLGFNRRAGKAGGGPIFGPGSGTSDDVPAMLSNGEHIWTTAEVNAAGGHGAVQRIRRAVRDGSFDLPRFAEGGPVFPLRDSTESVVRVASSPAAMTTSSPALVSAAEIARELAQVLLAHPRVAVTQMYPVHSDPVQDAWDAAQIGGPDV